MPFTAKQAQELPEEWTTPLQEAHLLNLASLLQIPKQHVGTTVCWVAPDEPVAHQYKQWLRTQPTPAPIDTIIIPAEEFEMTYGEHAVSAFRMSMTLYGHPALLTRVAWNLSRLAEPA